ncbi:hypothetical protein D3C71_2167720 [compost metagenome]
MERLRSSLEEESPKESGKGGIGLQNLHSRLRHMFGEGYGLHIESYPGEGTRVAIVVPRPRKGEADS